MKYFLITVAMLTLASCSHMGMNGSSGGPDTNYRAASPFSHYGDPNDIYRGG